MGDLFVRTLARWAVLGWVVVLTGAAGACAPAEDPLRVALRSRLEQEARLSDDEIRQVVEAVGRGVEGHDVLMKEGAVSHTLDAEQRKAVLSMLSDPSGVYDEGVRREGAAAYRVLNGPGVSNNAEIEAAQRLWVDIQTLLPHRYQFTYAFPGYGDYQYELTIQP